MNEQLLVDLIGNMDISLVNENFIEKDVKWNRGFILSSFYKNKKKIELSEKFDIKVDAVKKKMHHITGIISGIVLIGSVTVVIIRKKSTKFAI